MDLRDTPVTTSDGVRLNCVLAGEGRPVVLCHGFPDHALGWAPQMEGLGRDHLVIAPEGRGVGRSQDGPDLASYRLERLVADVAEVVADLCPEPPLLVGHDWGGAVAWAFASAHADKIAGLAVLSAPHPAILAEALANDPAQQAASSYMARLRSPGAAAVLAANDFAVLRPILDEQVAGGFMSAEERTQHLATWRRPGGLDGALNWYRANDFAQEPQVAAAFDRPIEAPVLLLWGSEDKALLPALAEPHRRLASRLSIDVLPGAGHWLQRERALEVNAALRRFAGQVFA